MQTRNLFDRTIRNGGGTFEMHAENSMRQDITSGFSVGLVDGTFAFADANDRRVFNFGIARAISEHPEADAIGTWVNDGRIHIDPVRIFASFDDALDFAIEKKQLAFFHLDTFTEFNTADEQTKRESN